MYNAVFCSDIHLGTPRCNTEKFFKFLQNLSTKKLVLVGDVIDIYCMEKYNTNWSKEHTKCVHELIRLAKNGTEIIYILGNHEGELRRYCDFEHDNFKMVNEYVHEDCLGNKFLCVHGDAHSQYSSGSWKQLIFNKGYEFITPLSVWLEKYFKFSLVYALKRTANGRKYIDQYEKDLIKYCKSRKEFDGVIVGHIHHQNMRRIDELIYMCCGDFVDTSSYIVEEDGIYYLKVVE